LAAVWFPQNYTAKKIVHADIKHTVMGSNGAAVLYTDDALCREAVGVSFQVLFIMHENFTLNWFTTWRSSMKQLWREMVEWEYRQVQIISYGGGFHSEKV